jgi:hypothetical protein
LVEAISDSEKMLKKVKRGISVYEEPNFEKSKSLKSLPVFEDQDMVNDLNYYLDLSVAKCTYSNKLDNNSKAKIV